MKTLLRNVLRLVRFGGLRRMPMSRAAIRAIGVDPLRDHFHEPLFHSLWHHHFDALAAVCPLLRAVPASRPGSFWMVRA